MQIIHSATIKGAGLLECGPYTTTEEDIIRPGASEKTAETKAIKNMKKNAELGVIDPL